MSKKEEISAKLLSKLVETNSIEGLSTDQLLSLFKNDQLLRNPSSPIESSIDPRSQEPIIFNPSRAARPHDYPKDGDKKIACPICAGNSTGIIDLADLSEGFTFINKNLYPVINPPEIQNGSLVSDGKTPDGLHFVQWTSSIHDRDWHNLSDEDCQIVLTRLAALERKLVSVGQELSRDFKQDQNPTSNKWYISIIKNVGAAVGGSLEHGHQQIVFSDLAPRRILNNRDFHEKYGEVFSAYLQSVNPSNLTVRDYGSASLVVSRFMRRPYEMILLLKNTAKRFVHELDQEELKAVALGWKNASQVIRKLMPMMNKEVAYNVITHNGPGAGLYFEFLPYTQEQGGFEQLGLSVCQMDPAQAVDQIRAQLD